MSFLNIMLCYYLSLEVVLQSMAKNSPTKKKHRNLGDTKACADMNNRRRENVKFIVTKCKNRFKF